MKKISAYYRIIQNLTCMGFFFTLIFAVKSFENAVPDEIYVRAGETVSYDFDVPVSVVLKQDSTEVFEYLTKDSPLTYCVNCRLFGIFPVKDITVMLVEPETVYASGMPVGIYAKTKGVLVIGNGEVERVDGREVKPSENLVKSGDYIVSVNGMAVSEKEDLAAAVNEAGGGKDMLGVWVRDDLAGIGTLTYYKADGTYAALGHAVSDSDTGTIMSMAEGYLYHTDIVGIKKGKSGTPGELSGIIQYGDSTRIGSIMQNTGLGIHGVLNGNLKWLETGECYEVRYKQDIRTGSAFIVSSVSGESKKYEVMVESVDYSGKEENKGILIRVTDPELLELTGGIVQGMSGSPIIQDGKLIGAVTHVLVNDPTRGYGIFIEKML